LDEREGEFEAEPELDCTEDEGGDCGVVEELIAVFSLIEGEGVFDLESSEVSIELSKKGLHRLTKKYNDNKNNKKLQRNLNLTPTSQDLTLDRIDFQNTKYYCEV
jgi:hypothetical protein